MNRWLGIFTICAGFQLNAQQAVPLEELTGFPEIPNQVFLSLPLEEKEMPDILSQVLPQINQGPYKPDDFVLDTYRESPVGYHFLYQFQIKGIPAEGQFIRAFVDKNLVLRQIIWNLRGVSMQAKPDFADIETLRSRLDYLNHVGEISRVWKYHPDGWQSLLKASVIEDISAFAEFRYYDASYNEVFRQDNASRFEGKDSVIRARVFNPDPLTSAQVLYGGEYQDFNDSDTDALNNQRFWCPLVVDFRNDSFFLRDSVFYYAEIENPISQQPVFFDTVADYTRSQPEFEFINSMYHLQKWVRRVHDLGFDLPGDPIQVDPHAANGADVSGFTPAHGDMALLFGEGGVDDAEDADVLVHELGHALSFAAAPGTNNGLQRTSFEEGNSDYFAMSYSRQISNYGWQKTFNWDGNVTWDGRVVTTTRTLPGDFTTNKYANGEIWVSALREIYDNLGPDITDRLVLCALYNQVNEMTFFQMANNCLQCDSIQNNGAYRQTIFEAMKNRGFMNTLGFKDSDKTPWRLLNSYGFAFRGEALRVDFGGSRFSGEVQVYDMQGKLLNTQRLDDALYYDLNDPIQEKGLYLLRVISDTNLIITFQIARH